MANDAVQQTIPRTINTGLGALFILFALYFLGGETLTDFALALIVGILIGTYSSVFTAAPLAVVLERKWGEEEPARRPQRVKAAPPKTATSVSADEPAPVVGPSQAAKPQPRPRAGSSKKKRRRRR